MISLFHPQAKEAKTLAFYSESKQDYESFIIRLCKFPKGNLGKSNLIRKDLTFNMKKSFKIIQARSK